MIQRTFGDHEGGRARLDFPPEGASCVMSLRLVDADQANALSSGSATAQAQPAKSE